MKNLEILNHYINGTRPYLVVPGGIEGKIQKSEHKVGDIWEDDKGFVYEQKNGYTVKCTRMGKVIQESIGNKICKDCKKDIKWSNDKKDEIYYNAEGMCYDCYLTFESRLRIKGLYKDYQTKKILLSQISLLKETEQKLVESLDYLKKEKVLTFVNENGLVEEWEVENKESIIGRIEKDLSYCKNTLNTAFSMLENFKEV